MTEWLLINACLTLPSIGAVLLMRKTIGRQLGASAAYALWLVVPVPLLATLPIMAPVAPGTMELPTLSVAVGVTAGTAASTGLSWTQPLAAIWLVGSAIVIVHLIHSVLAGRRLVHQSKPAPNQVFPTLVPSGLNRDRIRIGNGIISPVVVGLLRPVLLVPPAMVRMPDSGVQKMILEHELHHLRRRDNLVNLGAGLFQALFWFNPLVWMAYPAFRTDQELSCDARALADRDRQERARYGRALLDLSEARRQTVVATYWNHHHTIERRILMLKNHHCNTTPRKIAAALCVGAALTISFLAAAATSPQSAGDPIAESDATHPVPMVRVPPRYPSDAAKSGIDGHVILEFTVNEDGATEDIIVLESIPENLFDQHAKDAVSRWYYNPGRIDGAAAPVRVTQKLEFNTDLNPTTHVPAPE